MADYELNFVGPDQRLALAAAKRAEAAAGAAPFAIQFSTWVELAAATGMASGLRTQVSINDTGTHTDPVVGGTVLNAGVYEYSASPAGWGRVGNTDGQDAAASAATALATVTNTPDYNFVERLGLRDNLVVQETIVAGSVPRANGTLTTGLGAGFYMTAKIACRPGQVFYTNGKSDVAGDGVYGIHYYDKAGAIVAYTAGTSGPGTFTAPASPSTIVAFAMGFSATNDPVATLGIRRNLARRQIPDLSWFKQFTYGVNLVADTAQMTAGSGVRHATGVISTGLTGYYLTQYIPVLGNLLPVQINSANLFDGSFGWAWYDEYGKYISGTAGSATANVQVTPPAGAFFTRTTFNSATTPLANVRVYLGALPVVTTAATYADVVQHTAALRVRANLYDDTQFVSGTVPKSDGTTAVVGGAFGMTGWMPVVPGEQVAANWNTRLVDDTYGWHFAATSGGAVTAMAVGTPPGGPVTVPAGCYWARTGISTTFWARRDMVVRSFTAPYGKLAGRKWGHFGDSISAKTGSMWQQVVQDVTGLVMSFQDARGGRRMDQIFEMYQTGSPADIGSPTSGVSQGGVLHASLTQVAGDGSVPSGKPQYNVPSLAWSPSKVVFKGYATASTTLNVTSIVYGALTTFPIVVSGVSGQFVVITGQLTGAAGGVGTYTLAVSTTLGSSGTPLMLNGVSSWSTGNTLAQDLAPLDVVTVMLGTNDAGLVSSLGSLASTAGDGTYYGWLMRAFDSIIAAKPSLRVVPIVPMWAGSGAMNGTIAGDAIRAFAQDRALHVIDLQRSSGISAKSEASSAVFLETDKIHQTQPLGNVVMGRRIAGGLEQCLG